MQKNIRCISKYCGVLFAVLFFSTLILPSQAHSCNIPEPCINVTKYCEDAPAPGMDIQFWGQVINCGCVELTNVTVTDLTTGEILISGVTLACQDEPGNTAEFSGSYTPTTSPSTNIVEAAGDFIDSNGVVGTISSRASATCEIQEGNGGEGCTPGYWRNPKHYDDWAPTGLSPNDSFNDTFGVDYFPGVSLAEAVHMGGGGLNKLARHGTAALLSALHPDVDYPFTAAEVIAIVQGVSNDYDVDDLVEGNEQGCPF